MKSISTAVRDLLVAAAAPENVGPAKVILDYLDSLIEDEVMAAVADGNIPAGSFRFDIEVPDDATDEEIAAAMTDALSTTVDRARTAVEQAFLDTNLQVVLRPAWDIGADTGYARRDRPGDYAAEGRSDEDIRTADVGRIIKKAEAVRPASLISQPVVQPAAPVVSDIYNQIVDEMYVLDRLKLEIFKTHPTSVDWCDQAKHKLGKAIDQMKKADAKAAVRA